MQADTPPPALQPLLHDAVATLRAPAQAWSRRDGSMGGGAIDGIYVSDVRILRGLAITVADRPLEHIATLDDAADRTRFVSLARVLDGPGADPDVRATLTRDVGPSGAAHTFELASRRDTAVSARVRIALEPALDDVPTVKAGLAGAAPAVVVDAETASWGGDGIAAKLRVAGATLRQAAGVLELIWELEVPARGSVAVAFDLAAVESRNASRSAPAPRGSSRSSAATPSGSRGSSCRSATASRSARCARSRRSRAPAPTG